MVTGYFVKMRTVKLGRGEEIKESRTTTTSGRNMTVIRVDSDALSWEW